MRFETKEGRSSSSRACVPMEKGSTDPQKRALMRQCIQTVSEQKPVVAWSGIESMRGELERLDRLLYAATAYDTAEKCRGSQRAGVCPASGMHDRRRKLRGALRGSKGSRK